MNSKTTLPIDAVAAEVCESLRLGNVVLQAEPGAGKSTGLPLSLLKAGFDGRILMLEPRRLAAENVAARLALQLGEPLGKSIGLRMRGRTVTSNSTRLEVVTEGVLTRILQNDPLLDGVSIVIFDEFHERSIHADLGLALCLDVQREVRDDLKIMLMSATLDGDALCSHLGVADPISCEVRQHPVDIYWRATDRKSLLQATALTVIDAIEKHQGDALVFLPGVSEIERVARLLQARLPDNATVHRLHRGVSAQAQIAATGSNHDSRNLRRIILSTSIAETSLTIDGVSIVVDSGIERRSRLDASSGIERLESVMASKASAKQRTGRAGRTQAGVCYRLWSEESHATRAASWQAEILRSDLSALLLESGQWGVTDINTLPWIDAPPVSAIKRAAAQLQQLGLWSDDGLTAHGRVAAKLPVDPRIGHMLLWAAENGVVQQAVTLAALLDDMPRLPQADFSHAVLNLSAHHKRKAKQLSELVQQIVTVKASADSELDAGVLLAQAFQDRIARRRSNPPDDHNVRYQLSGGSGVVIHEQDPLTNHEYIVVASLGGQGKEARIFTALPLDLSVLRQWCEALFEVHEVVHWDDKRERVVAERQQRIGALVISSQTLSDISAELRAAALIDGIRKKGINCLNWSDSTREWQARVQRLRAVEGATTDLPAVSDVALVATLEIWLLPFLNNVSSIKALKQLDLATAFTAMLSYQQQRRLDEHLPQKYEVPSGALHKLRYTGEGNPVLAVKLQEMFGCRENPSIANGRITLKVELLSPARRPVQVTEDLGNFWHNSYPAVKKDLAGRYPKHPWPEDPLSAEATAYAKPRKRSQ